MGQTQILSNIRKILRSLNLESKRIQKAHGVSIPQLLCLDFLHESDRMQSTVKEISIHLNLNSSTVSGIVKRLQSKGLVAKLPNPEDRRGALIALTEAGANLVKDTPDLLHHRLRDRLAKLDPATGKQLHESLDLLVNLMGIEDVDASPLVVEGAIDDE